MNLKKTIAISLLLALPAQPVLAAGWTCTPIAYTTSYYSQGLAGQVIADVNQERVKHGLTPLAVSAELTRAAQVRAQEIAKKFSHTRPDGTSWSTVSSAAKGENIARGQRSAYRVMAAWMSSPGHRQNVLRESFGSIGVAAVEINGIMHWVQLFGR